MKKETSKVKAKAQEAEGYRKPDAYQVDRQGRAIVTIETLLKNKPFQDAVQRAKAAHSGRKARAFS